MKKYLSKSQIFVILIFSLLAFIEACYYWNWNFVWVSFYSIVDFKLGITLGYLVYEFSIGDAYIISVSVGFLITVMIEPFLNGPLERFKKTSRRWINKLKVFPRIEKIITSISNFSQKRSQQRIENFKQKRLKWGDLALFIFVAVPLPFTGTLSGMILAKWFDIPYLKSIYLILFGLLTSSAIVAVSVFTGVEVWDLL